jgi:hypothetical protein
MENFYLWGYKFWRIYGGVKFSYSLYNKSQFSDEFSTVEITNNKFLINFFTVSLSVGYNTVNVCLLWIKFYFKTAEIDGGKINMKAFNIGVIFYVL